MKSNPYHKLYEHLDRGYSENKEIMLSIVIPVHNETNTIGSILNKLPKRKDIEIIIVDDHSTDNSVEVIKKYINTLNLRLLKNETNLGYGETVIRGLKRARGEIVVTMDSDGQHLPEDIYNLVEPILNGEVDITIGSRYLGANYYELKTSTRLGEAIVEKIIQIFFGPKIMNNQNGFRAFKKEVLHILDNIKYTGYAFCTEVIVIGGIYNYRIKEVPIRLLNRQFGTSGVRLFPLALNIFSCLFRYYLRKVQQSIIKKDMKDVININTLLKLNNKN